MTPKLLSNLTSSLSMVIMASITRELLLSQIFDFIIRASLSEVSSEAEIPFSFSLNELPIIMKAHLLLVVFGRSLLPTVVYRLIAVLESIIV